MSENTSSPPHEPGFVLEVGCEELPPAFVAAVRRQRAALLQRLRSAGLLLDEAFLTATARRVVLCAREVAPNRDVLEEEVLGPPWKAAYRDGKPTLALQRFAERLGRKMEELYKKEKNGGLYVAGRKRWTGTLTELILQVLPGWIRDLRLLSERRLRLAPGYEFVRPVRWMVCLRRSRVLPVEVFGIRAGRSTRFRWKHRWKRVAVPRSENYLTILRQQGLDLALLENLDLARFAAEGFGGQWLEPEIQRYMVESPTLVPVPLPEVAKALPPEVVRATVVGEMKALLEWEDGKPGKRLLAVVDRPAGAFHAQTVAEGYFRLAEARLQDARYFLEKDLEVPFEERRPLLRRIQFLAELGSLEDKMDRLRDLYARLEPQLPKDLPREPLRFAALHCRNDQTTQMVREFPELEGTMARIYVTHARARTALPREWREPVGRWMEESYRPQSPDDPVPESPEGALLAAMDRLITLDALFSTEHRPSGTRDPLGFRRTALSLLRIAHEAPLPLPLETLLHAGIAEARRTEIEDFLMERWEHWWKERIPVEFLRAAREHLFRDPPGALRLAEWLWTQYRAWTKEPTHPFGELHRVAVRIHNLAHQDTADREVDPSRLRAREEKQLFRRLQLLRRVPRKIPPEEAFRAVQEAIPEVDAFFDGVLVMARESSLRRNRLALLRAWEQWLKEHFGALWQIPRTS